MRLLLDRFFADESGATAIEYGLIAALIFMVIVSSVTVFANKASAMFDTIMVAIRDAS
ncbi:MAG: Flp family type IVb pilin [Brevundimonas sp.]|nr:Flp family type IVb pilin [Brevundimonas sp.]